MKQDIKNKELQERQKYVPASVKLIEVAAQRVLCSSIEDLTLGGDDSDNWSLKK